MASISTQEIGTLLLPSQSREGVGVWAQAMLKVDNCLKTARAATAAISSSRAESFHDEKNEET